MPAQPGLHREDIKAGLRKRFGSIAAFAHSVGYSPAVVTEVLRRPFASAPLELLVANAIGKTPHEVWPDRWNADGTQIGRSAEQIASRKSEKSNSRVREAA